MTAVRPLLIGVNVGTTWIKAGLIDLGGRELEQASVPTRWRRLATGGEASPGDFLQSVRQVLAELLAAAPAGEVAGVGVTSMAETAILLDRDGQAIGPSVAWFDRRAADDYAQLTAEFPDGRTGLAPGEIPTVATLRWLMRSDPSLSRAVRSLAVAEWVAYGLGGSAAAEPSLASRTGALSIASREWRTDVLGWAGLPATISPACGPRERPGAGFAIPGTAWTGWPGPHSPWLATTTSWPRWAAALPRAIRRPTRAARRKP